MTNATQTRTIDGNTFTVSMLLGRASLRMLHRLIRTVGPGLAKAAGGVAGTSLKLGDLELSSLGDALCLLTDRCNEAEFMAITEELLGSATIDGQPLMGPQFDLLMRGRSLTVLKLLRFAIEVNYGDFSAALGAFARASSRASPLAA